MGRRSLGGVLVPVDSRFAISVSAHHAFSAEFDAKMPVTLQGTVTSIEMVNPHGWIYIDVKEPDGKVVNWAIETGGPNALARSGVKKGFLPIGQVVIVTGYRAKDMSIRRPAIRCGSSTAEVFRSAAPPAKDFRARTNNVH